MTRNEHQMYSDVSSIAKSLEKIANVLEHVNHDSYLAKQEIPKSKDIPGFEGTLDALDVLTDIKTYAKENLANMTEARDYYKEKYDTLTPTSNNPDPAGYGNKDPYTYETNLQGIRVDSDHDIRTTAAYYEEALSSVRHRDLKTKKDCILDYVTNEFGLHGARYTDIIKFCYYLGAHNAPKYSNSNRGYYSCAFNVRLNGHLIQGGKDFLVKGINNEGKERYFAHSSVDNFTGFYKRIA